MRNIGSIYGDDDATIARGLRVFGTDTNIKLWKEGIKYIYKMTQVANMVGWNERGDSNLEWNKAYEARNKIRQVIKELLEMPREGIISATTGQPTEENDGTNFDGFMAIKQVITFSPEDDLDNGPMNIDVFPKGITAVDVGGVAIEGAEKATVQDESGEVVVDATVGDGVVDDADRHFSHRPIDNGVFSKMSTNYIWVYDPNATGLSSGKDGRASTTIAVTSAVRLLKYIVTPVLLMPGVYNKLRSYWTGDCVFNDLYEMCRPMLYKGFLQVSF
jgi:hypothetical protein